jgi:hypothetical protein
MECALAILDDDQAVRAASGTLDRLDGKHREEIPFLYDLV